MAKRKPPGETAPPKKRARPKPGKNGTAPAQPAPAVPATPKPKPEYAPLVSYAEIREEAARWLWHRRLRAGCPTLLFGDQSAGKSTLAAAFAAAISGGRTLPGGPDLLPQRVVWFASEESTAQDVRPRLRLAGCDLRRVFDPHKQANGRRRRLTLPLHAPELVRICNGEGVGLLVFDPITSYIDDFLHPDAGSTARIVCESLFQIGEETGATGLLIRHPKKGAKGSLIERCSGSREWIQVPRGVLCLAVPDDSKCGRVLVTKKPGPPSQPRALACEVLEVEGTVRIEWGGECEFDEKTLGKVEDSPGEVDAHIDARNLLKLLLEEGQQPVKEIERQGGLAGLSIHQLRRAKAFLGATTHHEGGNSSREHYWAKPVGGWPQ